MDNHILIDSYFINNGGGKVLLDYLLMELDSNNIKPFLLLDLRVKENLPVDISKFSHAFVSKFSERNKFYKHKNFTKILCFGNIPPPKKTRGKIFTYFHQPLFLEIPNNFSLKNKLIYNLKIFILKRFSKNTSIWLVQSDFIKNKLAEKYRIDNNIIKILPFYPPISNFQKIKSDKIKHSYIYISNAPPHKNHSRLINAFCNFYDKCKVGLLTITVSDEFPELLQLIQEKQRNNYPIRNIGFVKRENLQQVYNETEYLIYPSLAESFGLGLVEAIENGCKIIGADLPYTYAVCKPSLIFDPLDENSIVDALEKSLNYDSIPESKQQVKNEIKELVNLLTEN